jgi:acyl carrier protein
MNDSTMTGPWTTEQVIAVIRTLAREDDLPEHLISGPINPQDTVDSLGIDSLGGAFLIERLEQLTGVEMPDDFIDMNFSIDGIAPRLNALVEKRG